MNTLFLNTLHDPEARLFPLIARLSDPKDLLARDWARVRPNYDDLFCVASPGTDARSNEALRRAGWEVAIQDKDGLDRGMFRTVRSGMKRGPGLIHFCDLDRFIHWLARFPDELRALPAIWDQHDLTLLVRSPRAFATHPPAQTLTEAIGIRAISAVLGVPNADALSGSYLWSRRAAEAVATFPGPHDLRFYAVGALAPFRAGCTVGAHVVEGLEWETPDQYPSEIAELGYDAWLARFQSPGQWQQRVEMAGLWVEEALPWRLSTTRTSNTADEVLRKLG